MARKKLQKKSPAKRKPSKKPLPKKKPSKAPPSKTKKKSPKSKKSSKPASYEVVTLDAKTLKQVKRPKKGRDIYYGLKSPKGKITKIESEYSQRFFKSDLDGLKRSLKEGSPNGYIVAQQFTRTPIKVKVGKKWEIKYKTHEGNIVFDAAGNPIKMYRYKLTALRASKGQRRVLMSTAGYVHAVDKGFPLHPTRAIKSAVKKGTKLVPVGYDRKGKLKQSGDIVLRGATIKDTVEGLKPSIGSRDMIRKGITGLGVDGHVDLHRPLNPYSKGSAEYFHRQAWIDGIWGNHENRVIKFGIKIDRLANFSDALSTAIRGAISAQGLRFTSLVNLAHAEVRAKAQDAEARRLALEAGRQVPRPRAGKILHQPTSEHNVNAADLVPLRPEFESGPKANETMHGSRSKANPLITISFSVEPL